MAGGNLWAMGRCENEKNVEMNEWCRWIWCER